MAPVPNPSASIERSRKEKCPAQGHMHGQYQNPGLPNTFLVIFQSTWDALDGATDY